MKIFAIALHYPNHSTSFTQLLDFQFTLWKTKLLFIKCMLIWHKIHRNLSKRMQISRKRISVKRKTMFWTCWDQIHDNLYTLSNIIIYIEWKYLNVRIIIFPENDVSICSIFTIQYINAIIEGRTDWLHWHQWIAGDSKHYSYHVFQYTNLLFVIYSDKQSIIAVLSIHKNFAKAAITNLTYNKLFIINSNSFWNWKTQFTKGTSFFGEIHNIKMVTLK